MQNSLREIIAYILRFYVNKEELSKYRLTKLVYLCDWCYAVSRGKQITNIHWFFDNYGPFVWDVIDIAKQENQLLLDINEHTNSDVIVMFKDESKDEFLNVVKTQRLGEIVSQDDTEYQKIIQSHPKSFLIDSSMSSKSGRFAGF